MPMKQKVEEVEIKIEALQQSRVSICILGVTPLITNTMSNKAILELLHPRGRLTAADKATRMKHNPEEEFRNSMWRRAEHEEGPTAVKIPTTAFKGTMGTAALDTPGTITKSRINRLVCVNGVSVDLYGLPFLGMDVVRMADINHTPDIRTRAYFPEWACRISVSFVRPHLTEQSIAALLSTGGVIAGIGDNRQEKGSGSFGQFMLVAPDDEDFARITTEQGRATQKLHIDSPVTLNADVDYILDQFKELVALKSAAAKIEPRAMKAKKANGEAPAALQ